jgi:thioredoxin-like negative regulator of GroEL
MINVFRSILLFFMLVTTGFAGETAFDQAIFDQLQKAGKPVLISIHADWCPTCRAQAPVLAKLLNEGEFKAINALIVDFDQQKDVVKAFNARAQSTLIVFKGGKEVGRSLGDTSEESIKTLLKKALTGG